VQRDLWNAEVEEAFAAVEEAGNEIIEVDIAPFQDAVAEMVDGFRGELGDVLDAIDATR
jgi:TRAP-type C4-dicarboxylate transport system substrate-binding protein